jgi:hypothetical protein
MTAGGIRDGEEARGRSSMAKIDSEFACYCHSNILAGQNVPESQKAQKTMEVDIPKQQKSNKIKLFFQPVQPVQMF